VKPYIISADACADLDGIWSYVAERAGVETASTFIWRFYDVFSLLAGSPSAGVAVPEFPGMVRKFPMGNYLVYYRSTRGRVAIWRVLHGKRSQLRVLRDGPPRRRPERS